MPFILLEIAMQAIALSGAIGPDLSDAPENRGKGRPNYRTGAATGSKGKARGRKMKKTN
jgi:hypothetical protein